jgi:hypothetical protein
MGRESNEYVVQRAVRRLAPMALALALAGCGSTSDLFKSSPLDLFSTSSKAKQDAPAAPGQVSTDDVDCPEVQVRTGASTLMIVSKPGDAEPAALDVRYQGSILRTARECHVAAGMMTMKIGIEGRIITGPVGGPGTVDVPLRLAIVQEGAEPKTIASRFGKEVVTLNDAVDRVTFTHIESDIVFPLPQPLGLLERYVVYVGFDPLGNTPVKKPPVKRKPVAKKPAAKPQG